MLLAHGTGICPLEIMSALAAITACGGLSTIWITVKGWVGL